MRSWQSYTPILAGQTDNAVATYTTQIGKFMLINGVCFFKFALVTSGTTTKTTTTDNFQVTLPMLSATNAGTSIGEYFACRVQNATVVNNANVGVIASNAQVATFQAYVIGTAAATITWAATGAGIGVLSNVITAVGSGHYEYAVA
jgi:hypothetical protein